MKRVDIKSGKDLVFHVARRITDSEYECAEASLKHLSNKVKKEGAKPFDPIARVDGGTLIVSIPKEKMGEVKKSIETELTKLKAQFGKKVGAKDIGSAIQTFRMG